MGGVSPQSLYFPLENPHGVWMQQASTALDTGSQSHIKRDWENDNCQNLLTSIAGDHVGWETVGGVISNISKLWTWHHQRVATGMLGWRPSVISGTWGSGTSFVSTKLAKAECPKSTAVLIYLFCSVLFQVFSWHNSPWHVRVAADFLSFPQQPSLHLVFWFMCFASSSVYETFTSCTAWGSSWWILYRKKAILHKY